MNETHKCIKALLNNIIDDDLKNLQNIITNNQFPYDERSIYEETIILKIQHEKSLAKLNDNLEKLILVLKSTNNGKNNTNGSNNC